VNVDYLALLKSESEQDIAYARTAKTARTPNFNFLQFLQSAIGGRESEESRMVPRGPGATRFPDLPTCQECSNLRRPDRDGFRRCLAAARGELPSVARRSYAPVLWLGHRCEGFAPLPADPDQRHGAERWPGL
jgi:hypothetical protein